MAKKKGKLLRVKVFSDTIPKLFAEQSVRDRADTYAAWNRGFPNVVVRLYSRTIRADGLGIETVVVVVREKCAS